jgi:hypothetical protein
MDQFEPEFNSPNNFLLESHTEFNQNSLKKFPRCQEGKTTQ